jgi:hypothetical protein
VHSNGKRRPRIFCGSSHPELAQEIAAYLQAKGRLLEREDGKWASFSARDAMLYKIL